MIYTSKNSILNLLSGGEVGYWSTTYQLATSNHLSWKLPSIHLDPPLIPQQNTLLLRCHQSVNACMWIPSYSWCEYSTSFYLFINKSKLWSVEFSNIFLQWYSNLFQCYKKNNCCTCVCRIGRKVAPHVLSRRFIRLNGDSTLLILWLVINKPENSGLGTLLGWLLQQF